MDSPMDLSREAALRIALAARALPDVPVRKLLRIIQERIDAPLTEQTLQRVTVSDLKIGLAGNEEDVDLLDTPMASLKEAVRILWGEIEPGSLPDARDLAPLQLAEKSIRVAIASNSGENLDGHFGSCRRFLIYQVSASARVLVDVRSTEAAAQAEDRNGYRRDLIQDCQVLYVVTIGGPAASKVVRSGIYPILKIQGGTASDILDALQGVMASAPPPWLAKLLGRAGGRLRYASDRGAGNDSAPCAGHNSRASAGRSAASRECDCRRGASGQLVISVTQDERRQISKLTRRESRFETFRHQRLGGRADRNRAEPELVRPVRNHGKTLIRRGSQIAGDREIPATDHETRE